MEYPVVHVTRSVDLPGAQARSPELPRRPAIEATVTEFTSPCAALGIEGPIIRLDEKSVLHDMALDRTHAPSEPPRRRPRPLAAARCRRDRCTRRIAARLAEHVRPEAPAHCRGALPAA